MERIAGRVLPNGVESITEAPPWVEPCRILLASDERGVRHGRIEWLASEVDQEFLDALEHLKEVAMRNRAKLILVSSLPRPASTETA